LTVDRFTVHGSLDIAPDDLVAAAEREAAIAGVDLVAELEVLALVDARSATAVIACVETGVTTDETYFAPGLQASRAVPQPQGHTVRKNLRPGLPRTPATGAVAGAISAGHARRS
jgi:hypothetical protein